MTDVGTSLLVLALVDAVVLAAILWPRLRRLQRLRRENDELQGERDSLVRENYARTQRILEEWIPPGRASTSGVS